MDVALDTGIPFQFETPVAFFEKARAPEGQRRRLGALISVETKDHEGETVLQDGLDLSGFLVNGWFNDNHSQETDGILGFPDPSTLRVYDRGEKLPDGRTSKARGTWVEGWILEGAGDDRSDRIWKLGRSLQKTPRRLGLSLEGSVLRRIGSDRKTIAKAKVRNVAITHCPVNSDTRLEVLAKSLSAVAQADDSDLERFYRALTDKESIPLLVSAARALTKSEAIARVTNRYPGIRPLSATRIVEWAQRRARGGS